MIAPGLDFVVDVFNSGHFSGSPQHLHFFKNFEEMQDNSECYKVENEIDHSFIFIDNNKAYVNWKNKAGRIKFCGSGAFALACAIIKLCEVKELYIISEAQIIYSYYRKKSTFLVIDPFPVEMLDENVYLNKDSGIYFLLLRKGKLIQNDLHINHEIERFANKYSEQIHGFCVFYLNNSQGLVRYFTPWHGRDEDYVTGSIHQYLTPLAFKLSNNENQVWTQCSKTGGVLHTVFDGTKVVLTGNCLIHKKSSKIIV